VNPRPRRLPTGTIGAEKLQPLRRQIAYRYEWLRRNNPEAEMADVLRQVAEELEVDHDVVVKVVQDRRE
jgi:hypothetical protein